MKTYNALSKSFTDEVKAQMGGGLSIDEAFNAIKNPIDINGHEYVDLGLPSGTMWATCNVGATKPEEYGLLFQFGRVDGYAYGDENNQFRTQNHNTEDTGNSYIPLTTSGKTYKEGEILDLVDDAAHIHMGGAWKMPNKKDLDDLYTYTTHEVKTIGNTSGMLFTSIRNGKQLFIPFAGNCVNGNFYFNGSDAYVWSSQVHPSDVNYACRLFCYSSGDARIDYNNRSYAFSVRGVFNK